MTAGQFIGTNQYKDIAFIEGIPAELVLAEITLKVVCISENIIP